MSKVENLYLFAEKARERGFGEVEVVVRFGVESPWSLFESPASNERKAYWHAEARAGKSMLRGSHALTLDFGKRYENGESDYGAFHKAVEDGRRAVKSLKAYGFAVFDRT